MCLSKMPNTLSRLSTTGHVQSSDLPGDVRDSISLMGEHFPLSNRQRGPRSDNSRGLRLQKPHLGKLWGSCGRMLHCTPIRKGNVKHMRCEKWAITRLRSRHGLVGFQSEVMSSHKAFRGPRNDVSRTSQWPVVIRLISANQR